MKKDLHKSLLALAISNARDGIKSQPIAASSYGAGVSINAADLEAHAMWQAEKKAQRDAQTKLVLRKVAIAGQVSKILIRVDLIDKKPEPVPAASERLHQYTRIEKHSNVPFNLRPGAWLVFRRHKKPDPEHV